MSYTARAYREFSGVLGRTLDEIIEDDQLSDEENISERNGIARVVEKIAEIFQADNPKGFDKDRFFDDVYGPDMLKESEDA